MRVPAFCAAALVASCAIAAPITYELPPETAMLRPGPGVEVAEANCGTCHSADYLAIQPPNKGKAFWAAEVAKMINIYKAPITDADAKQIIDYLANAY